MTLVSRFCHMSSVRSTSDGRGPVTRKRVPDREEQGKPDKDALRGRCHPLEAGFWPLWMTPLPRKTITEYRILLPTSDVIAEVSLALSYPEPFRVTGLCLWIFGEYISQNRSHPQGPKSEFKEVTAAHRMSLLRFPWLFPIRNPCELRGLYRRSYFGPRT